MVPVSLQLREGGEMKCAKLNCTPLAQGMIEPSVNSGSPIRSSKSLKLEMLEIDSRTTKPLAK